jgi:homoserine kinase
VAADGGWRVGVPASSANLGPGFDTFAAALSLELELLVSPSADGSLVVEADVDVPRDRSNLVVRAFERLHPAAGLRFSIRSGIPLTGGLGSSAAAIVAGLVAGRACAGGKPADLLPLACELEGHPDNVAAALHGGVVVCADGRAERFDPPAGIDALLLVPDEAVRTAAARAALPAEVPLAEAVFNTAHGALLLAGLVAGDARLIARGLADRLHQARRAHLFPQSYELLGRAAGLGALGATISGAGPTVLFWCEAGRTAGVRQGLVAAAEGWARVMPVGFAAAGARLRPVAAPGQGRGRLGVDPTG